MGKNKNNKKQSQLKRREMIQDVFKKGKKQREIAKKFDDKIAQRQGIAKKKAKFQHIKTNRKQNTVSKDQIAELDKKFEMVRASKKF